MTARRCLGVLRRRKWIVLQAVLLVPLAAVVFSLAGERLYEASAAVLLTREDLSTTLAGTPKPLSPEAAVRNVEGQARLARTRRLATRVLAEAGVRDRTAGDFLAASEVSRSRSSDVLEFRVVDQSPVLAARLASEYARQFAISRREADKAALRKAKREVRELGAKLELAGEYDTRAYTSLLEKERQLGVIEALDRPPATVIEVPEKAEQVQPRPVRMGIFGLVLGLALGLALAVLVDARDTRVRSAKEIREMLGLPLLARVPGPPRERQEADALATLAEPESAEAKAFRLLAANLDLHDLRRAAPVLIVASPVESESTSTTAANLGIALARSGRRVALVDLDLRRPALHRSFDLWRPGVAEVLLGHVRLEDAVTPISLRAADATNQGVDGSEAIGGWPSAASPDELIAAAERGIRERRPDLLRDVARRIAAAPREERLEVLSAGALAADPGPLLESDLLSDLLDDMRDRAELVLVDSPPLLDRVDTGAGLDIRADAVLVVVDLDIVTRPMIAELRRVLAGWPAEKLGFVLTGAEREEPYGYGRDYAHGGSLPSQQRQLA